MTRDSQREIVALLRGQGMGYKRIAVSTGVPRTTVYRWIKPESERASRSAWRERNKAAKLANDRRYDAGCQCASCGTVTGALDEAGESRCLSCQREAREAMSFVAAMCGCGSPMLSEAEMCGLCEIELQHA